MDQFMTRKSWIQDPETGKLIPREEWYGPRQTSAAVHGTIEPFRSPIDDRIISDRAHLRDHNRQHGVTDSRDYSHEFMVKRSNDRVNRMMGRTPEDRRERKELIRRIIER